MGMRQQGRRVVWWCICLSLPLGAGCGPEAQVPSPPAEHLAIWHSAQTGPKEKLEAAKRLVSRGMTAHEVERILGPRGTWVRYHGPSVGVLQQEDGTIEFQKLPDHDEWYLEYTVPGGIIMLEFDTSGFGADRGSWRLLRVELAKGARVLPPLKVLGH